MLGDDTPVMTAISLYEEGVLDEQEMVEFFQRLIDSGLAWMLHDHYEQVATALLARGLCKPANAADGHTD